MNQHSFFSHLAPCFDFFHARKRKTAQKFMTYVQMNEHSRVIDIGGGTGAIAASLASRVKSITVLDPNEKMIQRCKQKKSITCVQGSAEQLPFGDASFDVALLSDSFHHIPDQAAALREVHRVLTPGGRVALEEFNANHRRGWFMTLMEHVLKLGSHFVEPQALQDMLEQAGFRVTLHEEQKWLYYAVGTKLPA